MRFLIAIAVCLVAWPTWAGQPKFFDHPATTFLSKPTAVKYPDFNGRDSWAKDFRTRIRNGLKSGPNYAGHYSLIIIGCGTSCILAYFADAKSGQVFSFPFGGEDQSEMTLDFKFDSKLINASWRYDDDTCAHRSMVFNGKSFDVIYSSSSPRETFCN